MSLTQGILFLHGVFQMTAIALVFVTNGYLINGLHLFWDTLYIKKESWKPLSRATRGSFFISYYTMSVSLSLSIYIYIYVWVKSTDFLLM